MRAEVWRDRRRSSADFVRVVWPVLQQQCPAFRGSRLRLVESRCHELVARELDLYAGIDAYQLTPMGLRGMALRVQWGTNHQSFTVRTARPSGTPTEYGKRLAALQHHQEGFLAPYWTIQAYVSQPGGTLLSVAVARTSDLYRYIASCEQDGRPCEERPAGNGGERFLVVAWQSYCQAGHSLWVSASPASSA